jgi:hypothetical protein
VSRIAASSQRPAPCPPRPLGLREHTCPYRIDSLAVLNDRGTIVDRPEGSDREGALMWVSRSRRGAPRTFSVVTAAVLLSGFAAAGPVGAAGRAVTLQVRPVIVGWDDAGCGEWGVTLALVSLKGDEVGLAHPCADVVTDVNRAGTWRVLVVGHVELQLQGGTASGPVHWDRQVWLPDPADPEVIERFTADLTGEGAYAGMSGTISGGGIVQWDGDEPVDSTLWTITLRPA